MADAGDFTESAGLELLFDELVNGQATHEIARLEENTSVLDRIGHRERV